MPRAQIYFFEFVLGTFITLSKKKLKKKKKEKRKKRKAFYFILFFRLRISIWIQSCLFLLINRVLTNRIICCVN